MSFISDLTELVKAVGAIITAVQKHPPEPPINKPHLYTLGSCNSGCIHQGGVIIVPHCARCGLLVTRDDGKRCPFFT